MGPRARWDLVAYVMLDFFPSQKLQVTSCHLSRIEAPYPGGIQDNASYGPILPLWINFLLLP